MNHIAIDFETFYSKKLKYGLRQLIAEEYCTHDLFDCYLVAVCDGKNSWAGHPRDLNWSALERRVLCSHNARFDRTVYNELVRRKLAPQLNIPKWHCTANLTSFICNRRALADSVEHLFGVRPSKDYRNVADGKNWPNDYSEAERTQIIEAGRADAFWCWNLFEKFGPKWPEVEQHLSNITVEQGMYGVQIDRALLSDYINWTHEAMQATEALIPWIQDDIEEEWDDFTTSPTSTKCIAEQCRRVGIPCPPVKSHDEDGYEDWEATYYKNYPWIKAVGEWRSINKLYKTFLTVKRRLRHDSTLPFALKYFGAHCFPGETEVLTADGWVPLKHWAGGRIMQYRVGELLFDDAFANVFSASGEKMLQAKTGQVEFEVTTGHWCATLDKKGNLVKRQAGDLRNVRTRIPLSGKFTGGEQLLTRWEVQLIAAVQADGHYLTDCNSIRFRFTKTRKIERMINLLNQSGLEWVQAVHPVEPLVTVITIRGTPEWLLNRKQWGAWLLRWTPEAREWLMLELVHWDGSACGPNSIEYSTTDPVNADWISTLAHLTGRAATVVRRNRQDENWSDSYRVFIREDDETRLSPNDWEETDAPPTVFCPTSRHGVCLFRHNGSIFVSGQTGRWSGDAKINFQNMRRKPLIFEDHKIDFRALITPRPGYKLIASDLSQIEPRVLAWLGGNHKLLAKVSEGYGVYEAFARTSMGYDGAKFDKTIKSSDWYKMLKIQVLGLGYGAGWEKFISIALNEGGIDLCAQDPEFIEEEDPFTNQVRKVPGYGSTSRNIVNAFRAANPCITGMWKSLDESFKRSIGEDFTVSLPSGRKLTYEKVRLSVQIVKDKKTGKPKREERITAEVGGIRKIFYGGKLAENVTQAAARDVFGAQVVAMDKLGWRNLFSVHDEAVLEVKGVTAKEVEEVMGQCPEWMPGLPVAAEAKELERYEK